MSSTDTTERFKFTMRPRGAGMSGFGLELHEACSTGDYDSLEDYLKSGKYDINMKDPDWKLKTPLHWACAKGFVDCIRLLLEYGADGTARMEMGWTPAHCAAEAGKLTVLRALHTASIPVNKKDKYGDTPRRLAESYGHHDCVNYLIQAEKEQMERRKKAGKTEESDDEAISDKEET